MTEPIDLGNAAERERLEKICETATKELYYPGPSERGQIRKAQYECSVALRSALALIKELLTENEQMENLLRETGCFEDYGDGD